LEKLILMFAFDMWLLELWMLEKKTRSVIVDMWMLEKNDEKNMQAAKNNGKKGKKNSTPG
jgi:hypothetical protein